MASKDLAVLPTKDGLPDYDNAEVLDVIRQQAAKGCNDAEFKAALHLARAYGLDFLAKEVWAVKRNQGEAALVVVSRDGYLKAARRQASFVGLVSSAVHQNDTFSVDPVTCEVRHTFGLDRGPLVAAYAIAKRSDHEPTLKVVYLAEQKGNSPVWAKFPGKMLVKCAEVDALKSAFGLTGLVSEDDLDGASFGQAPEDPGKAVPAGSLKGARRKPEASVVVEQVEAVEVAQADDPLEAGPAVIEGEFEEVQPVEAAMAPREFRRQVEAYGDVGVAVAKAIIAEVGGPGAMYRDLTSEQRIKVWHEVKAEMAAIAARNGIANA